MPLKYIYIIIVCMVVALCTTNSAIFADEQFQCANKPFGVFFSLHMEAGRGAPDLEYQRHYWPRLVEVVALADEYNAKLTLLFNPQWAEYILIDDFRLQMVKVWQANGHEVGLHYHLVTHRDWNGYTNRKDPIYTGSPLYRGTVDGMIKLMERLAYPEQIKTTCSGPDIVTEIFPFCVPVSPGFIEEIDFPQEAIYDIDGIHDGRISPIQFEFKRQHRYHLRHGVAITEEDVKMRLQEIETAQPDEIVGLVTHACDYDPVLIEKVFQDLSQRDIQVRTVSRIMDDYLQ